MASNQRGLPRLLEAMTPGKPGGRGGTALRCCSFVRVERHFRVSAGMSHIPGGTEWWQ